MQEKQTLPLQLIRLPALKARVPLCRSQIYAMVAAKKFPKPIPIGPRAVAWDSRAIDAWIAERIAEASKA